MISPSGTFDSCRIRKLPTGSHVFGVVVFAAGRGGEHASSSGLFLWAPSLCRRGPGGEVWGFKNPFIPQLKTSQHTTNIKNVKINIYQEVKKSCSHWWNSEGLLSASKVKKTKTRTHKDDLVQSFFFLILFILFSLFNPDSHSNSNYFILKLSLVGKPNSFIQIHTQSSQKSPYWSHISSSRNHPEVPADLYTHSALWLKPASFHPQSSVLGCSRHHRPGSRVFWSVLPPGLSPKVVAPVTLRVEPLLN